MKVPCIVILIVLLLFSLTACFAEPQPIEVTEYKELGCINLSIPTSWERILPGINSTIHYEFETGFLRIQAVRNYHKNWWEEWKKQERVNAISFEFKNEKQLLLDTEDAMYIERMVYYEDVEALEKIIGFKYGIQMFTISLCNTELSKRDLNTKAFEQIIQSVSLTDKYEKLIVPLFEYPIDYNIIDLSSKVTIDIPSVFKYHSITENEDSKNTKHLFICEEKNLEIEVYYYPNDGEYLVNYFDEKDYNVFELGQNTIEDYISRKHLNEDLTLEYYDEKHGVNQYDLKLVSTSDGTDLFLFSYIKCKPEYSCYICFLGAYDNMDEASKVFPRIITSIWLKQNYSDYTSSGLS